MESRLWEGISTKRFYNSEKPVTGQLAVENLKYVGASSAVTNIAKPLPFRLKNVRGPSLTWKIFKKQNDAIQCARTRKNGLMVFPYEYNFNSRLFLVAHPKIFWHYDCNRNSKYRCTYELISEFAVCKLYFDLEFEFTYNPEHDGVKMVDNFISVVCYFIKKQWNIICTRESVLDLDSTTDKKFSRHLIFHLQNAAFRDNYNVGAFVTFVCSEIKKYILWHRSIKSPEKLIDSEDLQCYTSCMNTELNKFNILEFMVHDCKGTERLFCDEGVYTKNRHFRLFHSTKYGKNAPLVLNKENIFKHSFVDCDVNETLFLDSLITYVNPVNLQNFQILEYCINENIKANMKKQRNNNTYTDLLNVKSESQFPFIDGFIAKLVIPGKIWRSVYFYTTGHLVYDIVGYRFCHNIGREHRSNNIKYVVDIQELCFYQKCYDPDCRDFRSPSTKLPAEISFFLEDDSLFVSLDNNAIGTFTTENASIDDDIQNAFSLSNQDLNEVLSVIEDISSVQSNY